MRSFFNRPAWASTTGDSDSSEFYRRSRQTYTDILAANRRRQESVTSSGSGGHHTRDEKAPKSHRASTSSVSTGSDSIHLVVNIDPHCSTARDSDDEESAKLENSLRRYPDDITDGAVDVATTAECKAITNTECPSPEGVSSSGLPYNSTVNTGSVAFENSSIPREVVPTARERLRGNWCYQPEMPCSENIQESLATYHLQVEATQHDTPQSNYSSREDNVVQILITSEIENTKPLIVQRRMSQRLRDVRLAWCRRQGFGDEMTSSVFLTWKGKRLFDVTTCKSLGIENPANANNLWPSDSDHGDKGNGIRIHMEATTDGLLESRKRNVPHDFIEYASDIGKHEEDGNGGFLRIVLKSPGLDDLRIKVRPHTEFSHVIATFRDKKKIPLDKKVQLLFDGELVDPDASIQDLEITDLDLVDVLVK